MIGYVSFFVQGIPRPAGSRSYFGHAKSGKAIMAPANKHQKSWQELIRMEAKRAWAGSPLLLGPVMLTSVFLFPRPDCHYRTGKNRHLLRSTAPRFMLVKPDEDKLQRALRDALTGIVFKDDAQIVRCLSLKRYTDDPDIFGVKVDIGEWNAQDYLCGQP